MSNTAPWAVAASGRGSIHDRLLQSSAFRQWAVRFPLTRWIARRRARRLFDLCAGFVYSQILAACVQLRLFELLADGPRELGAVARATGLSEDAARRLVEAARSLGLLRRQRNGWYALGASGAVMAGDAGLRAMVEHHHLLYADLADPVAFLRGAGPGRLAAFWGYTERARRELIPGDAGPYSALMGASQAMVAAEVLDAYPIGRHRHVLDIGGGDGSFLAAVGARAAGIHLTLFDLPAVVAVARANPALAGVRERLTFAAGDFRSAPLPGGADVATLVRVLHDHDDDVVLDVLRAARAALQPGGALIVAEPMADLGGAEAVGHAYFGIYLLALGQGRPRSPAELRTLLLKAGFHDVRAVPTRLPLVTGVVIARA